MRRVLACAETLDAWVASTKYGEGTVSFLCVGCDGPETASRFVAELGLEHCMLGFIKSPSDRPRWGQLGCSGFIIVDAQKRIVTKATAAYLQAVALDIVNEPKKHGNKGVVLDTVDQVDGECSQLLHVQQAHNIAAAAAKERQKGRTGVPLLRPCSGRSFLPTCSKARGEPMSRQLELGARCGSKVAIYDADPHEAKQLLHQLKRNETPARYSESEAVRLRSKIIEENCEAVYALTQSSESHRPNIGGFDLLCKYGGKERSQSSKGRLGGSKPRDKDGRGAKAGASRSRHGSHRELATPSTVHGMSDAVVPAEV